METLMQKITLRQPNISAGFNRDVALLLPISAGKTPAPAVEYMHHSRGRFTCLQPRQCLRVCVNIWHTWGASFGGLKTWSLLPSGNTSAHFMKCLEGKCNPIHGIMLGKPEEVHGWEYQHSNLPYFAAANLIMHTSWPCIAGIRIESTRICSQHFWGNVMSLNSCIFQQVLHFPLDFQGTSPDTEVQYFRKYQNVNLFCWRCVVWVCECDCLWYITLKCVQHLNHLRVSVPIDLDRLSPLNREINSQGQRKCPQSAAVRYTAKPTSRMSKIRNSLGCYISKERFWLTIALVLKVYIDSGIQRAEQRANISCLKDVEGASVPVSSTVPNG